MKRSKKTHSFVAIVPALLISCVGSYEREVVYGNPPGVGPTTGPQTSPATAEVVSTSSQKAPEVVPVLPSRENNWGNSAACPKDLSALREASCDHASKLTCKYEECMGRPAVTASCDTGTKKWREEWVRCNPPAP
jgi:hypothetical protein